MDGSWDIPTDTLIDDDEEAAAVASCTEEEPVLEIRNDSLKEVEEEITVVEMEIRDNGSYVDGMMDPSSQSQWVPVKRHMDEIQGAYNNWYQSSYTLQTAGTTEMGPAEEGGPKLFRLLYFVGAGFLCTAAINKWRDLERKSALRQEQQQKQSQLSENIPSPAPAAE